MATARTSKSWRIFWTMRAKIGRNSRSVALSIRSPGYPLERLIESYLDDMDDDAGDRLDGVEDLEKACAVFREANKDVKSWYEDRKHKVRVPGRVHGVLA